MSKVSLAPPAAIPNMLKFTAWDSTNKPTEGYSTANLGAWNDPKNKGTYKYIFVIVIEGCDLKKCVFERFASGTFSCPIQQIIKSIPGVKNVNNVNGIWFGENGKGYQAGGKATDSDYNDSPNKFMASVVFATPDDEAGVVDAPGPKGLPTNAVPFTFRVNFFFRIRRGNNDVKCVYYDVDIVVDKTPGPATNPPRLLNWTVKDPPCK